MLLCRHTKLIPPQLDKLNWQPTLDSSLRSRRRQHSHSTNHEVPKQLVGIRVTTLVFREVGDAGGVLLSGGRKGGLVIAAFEG